MFDSAFLIGTGGTGGHLAPALCRLLNYHPTTAGVRLMLVDGDSFDKHNAERQLCGHEHVGINKAEAMLDLLLAQGLTNTAAFPAYVNKAAISKLLRRHHCPLIVMAVDNDASRKASLEAVEEAGLDGFFWITAGNAGAEDPAAAIRGNVLWWGHLGDTPYGFNPAMAFPNIEEPEDDIPAQGTCAANAPSSPQLISANALSAALTLTTIQNLLDGVLDPGLSTTFFCGRQFKLSAA